MAAQVLTKCCWICPVCGLSGEVPPPDPDLPMIVTLGRAWGDHQDRKRSKGKTCSARSSELAYWIEEIQVNDDLL